DPECNERGLHADPEQRDHEREQRDARNRLEYAEGADHRLREPARALEGERERQRDENGGAKRERDEEQMLEHERANGGTTLPQVGGERSLSTKRSRDYDIGVRFAVRTAREPQLAERVG